MMKQATVVENGGESDGIEIGPNLPGTEIVQKLAAGL
jgi:hypothetical protein